MCSSTQISCVPQLWPPTTQSSIHTYRPTMGNTPTASEIPEPANITAFTVPSKENPSRQGYDSRDRLLWLFEAHVSSTMACLMLSRHHALCSLASAFICAVLHTSLESPPAGCTREYASCALCDTTLFVSRESSVHHCLSLKAALSSLLRDSTTVWSAEAFNTTRVVVVRGKTSCVTSRTAARWPPSHLNSAARSSSEGTCEHLCLQTQATMLRLEKKTSHVPVRLTPSTQKLARETGWRETPSTSSPQLLELFTQPPSTSIASAVTTVLFVRPGPKRPSITGPTSSRLSASAQLHYNSLALSWHNAL